MTRLGADRQAARSVARCNLPRRRVDSIVAGDQGSFDKVKGTADEYQAVAVLHPNIWYGRGPGQVGASLDNARRAGPRAIAPLGGWRQALNHR
ncbi:hypothetical protein M2271_005793 [Streptomyces sp. LBL]|nr:hypothetical protein [Streptomyces sp. LBL]